MLSCQVSQMKNILKRILQHKNELKSSKRTPTVETASSESKNYHFWKQSAIGNDLCAHRLYPEDTFLVSYPRSGNTWVRNIVARILYPSENIVSLKHLNLLVPDIHKDMPQGIPGAAPSTAPRVIKTHRPFPLRHNKLDGALYKRNIYVSRHPYKVVLSLFHYRRFFEPDISLAQVIYEFTVGDTRWSSWQQHFLSWKAQEKERDILFLRYEDLRERPIEEIIKISDFLNPDSLISGLKADEAKKINEACSLESMLEMEKRGSTKPQSFQFVRRQKEERKISEKLTDEMKVVIYESCKYSMDLLGYATNL